MTESPHTWTAAVSGFDFGDVFVRAATRSRARALVAQSFEEAGWGSFKEGLEHVSSIRLTDELSDWPLIYPKRGPEGLVRPPMGFRDPRTRYGESPKPEWS